MLGDVKTVRQRNGADLSDPVLELGIGSQVEAPLSIVEVESDEPQSEERSWEQFQGTERQLLDLKYSRVTAVGQGFGQSSGESSGGSSGGRDGRDRDREHPDGAEGIEGADHQSTGELAWADLQSFFNNIAKKASQRSLQMSLLRTLRIGRSRVEIETSGRRLILRAGIEGRPAGGASFKPCFAGRYRRAGERLELTLEGDLDEEGGIDDLGLRLEARVVHAPAKKDVERLRSALGGPDQRRRRQAVESLLGEEGSLALLLQVLSTLPTESPPTLSDLTSEGGVRLQLRWTEDGLPALSPVGEQTPIDEPAGALAILLPMILAEPPRDRAVQPDQTPGPTSTARRIRSQSMNDSGR